MTPEKFLENVKAACGENLLSFVIYGSSASGDAIAGKSDYNVMLVLKETPHTALKAIAAASKDWLKKGNPPPLIFTREQLATSGDSFPIELADMKEFHKVLYGADLLTSITISPADLRLAVERELKGKLIQLRGAYLSIGGEAKPLTELMTKSLSAVLVLCRAALRLRSGAVPGSKLDCAVELKKHLDFEPEVFRTLVGMRRGERGGDAEEIFGRYMGAIEKLSAAVDGWEC